MMKNSWKNQLKRKVKINSCNSRIVVLFSEIEIKMKEGAEKFCLEFSGDFFRTCEEYAERIESDDFCD